MANYKNLNIFTPSLELYKVVLDEVGMMNRKYRFTLGMDMHNYSNSILKMIHKINKMTDKTEGINKLLLACVSFECDLMVCREMRILSNNKISKMTTYLVDITEQANKWKKYTENKKKSESTN